MTWLSTPAHARWLEAEGDRLLAFGRASRHPEVGFAWLDETGVPDLARPVELWVSCRMTHVYALGHLLGRPGSAALVDHGLQSLHDRFHDHEHGGWYAKVGPDGPDRHRQDGLRARLRGAGRVERHRGRAAGRPRAAARVARRAARAASGTTGPAWSSSSGTRRSPPSTATAASTPTCTPSRRCSPPPTCSDDPTLRARALRITTRVVHDLAAGNDWRIPEHFDADVDPGARLQPRRAGAPVPALRRDHRPLAGVVAARARPPGGAGRRGAGLDAARRRRAVRRRRRARAGRSTAPTASSTPSTGRAHPSCASGCTGSPRRRPPPRPRCTR